jgi:hypothetical protein
MGHVLPFARSLPEFPTTAAALDAAEGIFLVALRWWLADTRQGNDPLPRLRRLMMHAGVPDVAHSVDYLMRVVARTARWQVDVRCAYCPSLSYDERRLLRAAALTQAGEIERAKAALRSSMLSALGAEFALGPLEGLGALLRDAGLVFPRRAPGFGRDPVDGGVKAWTPPLPAPSVH